MKKLFTQRLGMLLSLPLFSLFSSAQNMIVNPSAESPVSTGWTVVRAGTTCGPSQWRMQIGSGYPAAQNGTYYFNPGCGGVAGTDYEIHQDVDVRSNNLAIDGSIYQINFSGYLHSYAQTPPDEARITVEFRNATGTGTVGSTVLGSFGTGTTTHTSGWTYYAHTAIVPANTRWIRVRLIGTHRSGDATDAYFDNLSLTSAVLLPVQLTNFTATGLKDKVTLDWQTTSEQNNKGFHVQSAADGQHWNTIGFVAGTNKSTVQQYTYTDTKPFFGGNYYRLLQEDVDGKQTTYETKYVKLGGNTKPSIFPNPVHDVVNVRSISATATMEILNAAGSTLGRYQKQNSIRVAHLQPGVYYLKIEDGGKVEMLKFMKQ